MTPASAALGVPCLVEPGEGAKGGEQINNQRFSGRPQGNRTVVNLEEFPVIPLAIVA